MLAQGTRGPTKVYPAREVRSTCSVVLDQSDLL